MGEEGPIIIQKKCTLNYIKHKSHLRHFRCDLCFIKIRYRRSGFNCEYLLNTNCEVFMGSQSFHLQS